MENNIQVFTNQLFGSVRIVIDDQNNPWFIASDVAKILGYRDSFNMTRIINDSRDKGTLNVSTPGGQQNMTIINESGLYNAIFSSRLPAAIEFKHWVTSEVLPTMRKLGFTNAIEILKNRVSELESQNKYLYDQNYRTGELSFAKTKAESENMYLTHYIITNPYIPEEYKVQAFNYDPTLYNPDIDMQSDIQNFKNSNEIY